MYGFVYNVLRKLVVKKFGEEEWQRICVEAGYPLMGTGILDRQFYDEAIFAKLGSVAERRLGIPLENLLELLGTFFFDTCKRSGYYSLLRTLGYNLYSFLRNLDSLHDHLSFTYTDIRAPSFTCDKTAGGLTLHYYSQRHGLSNFVIGIVKAIAKDFYHLVIDMHTVEYENVKNERLSHHYVFDIVVQECSRDKSYYQRLTGELPHESTGDQNSSVNLPPLALYTECPIAGIKASNVSSCPEHDITETDVSGTVYVLTPPAVFPSLPFTRTFRRGSVFPMKHNNWPISQSLLQTREDLARKLWEAVDSNDIDQVRRLLEQGADPDQQMFWSKDWQKLPPLHKACSEGYKVIVETLVDHGACVDKEDTHGQTPLRLSLASERFYKESCVSVAEYLVKKGYGDDCDKGLLLCGLCQWGKLNMVKDHIEQHGVNPNDVNDGSNMTPLHCACSGGNLPTVVYLAEEHHCSVDKTDKEGNTPLDVATEQGKTDIVDYLKSLSQSHGIKELHIQAQPEDIMCKPGQKAQLFVRVNSKAATYQWYYNDTPIPTTDIGYEGSTTDHLTVLNCLSMHNGAYKCVVTDPAGTSVTSKMANLNTCGEQIGTAESKLLGEILQAIEVDFSVYGIDPQELVDGKSHVTYEEIQLIMMDNSITQILSENLKVELVSRLEEERLYHEAMAKGHKISLSYTKILALGPGQVGKSTFLYRLMGLIRNIQTADPMTQPQSSTGVAELHEACIKYTRMTGALTDKNWYVFDGSTEIRSQLEGLIALLSKQAPDFHSQGERATKKATIAITARSTQTKLEDSVTTEYQANPTSQANKHGKAKKPAWQNFKTVVQTEPEELEVLSVPNIVVPHKQNISKVIQEFEKLQRASKHSLTQEKSIFHMLFNIVDIGGQPAFLEMLPSLTIGPALYLVFMKLLEGLKTRYPAAFKCKEGRGTKLCQNYTYTSEEVIFTALSSIACFGNSDEEVEKYVANKADKKQTNSLALLVGTHADKIEDQETLNAIDDELKQHVEETEFYTEGLIHSQKFLRVNNFSAGAEEIQEHRQLLEDILTVKFRQYDIPARWLMLSICLKLLAKNEGTHEVSFDDCVEIGSYFQMSEDMVKIALQFLHKYIGLVMYFPNHESLKNVVICDPQAVFTSISELIFKIYDPTNLQVTEAQHDYFVQTGCFSPQDIKPLAKDGQDQGKLLSITTLIDLLVHLNIAAEVSPISDRSQEATGARELTDTPAESPPQRREYIFPAVLQTADIATLEHRTVRGTYEEQLPEPICIRFKTGYMPLGFVCALTAKLLAERKFQLIFKDGSEVLTYKNLLKFRYNGEFDILVISGLKYCEFRVTRRSGNVDFWNSGCCPLIKKTICDAADSVIRSMKHGSLYKLSKGYELAFKCPQHQDAEIGHEPLATLNYVSTTQAHNLPKKIRCVKPSCGIAQALTPEMKMWFGEALPDIPLEISTKPSLKGNKLKITAQGSKPLKFQWFKDEEPLTNSVSYNGSTTAELVIAEISDCEMKGMYKCCVTDRKGTKTFSGEIEFDPFVLGLSKFGVTNEGIRKLKDLGCVSLEDLKELDNTDLEEMSTLDRKRLNRIIIQVCGKTSQQNTVFPPNLKTGPKEVDTMVKCCETLIHAMSLDPLSLVAAFFGAGFVSDEVLNEIAQLNETKKSKGTRLYHSVLTVVKAFPSRFADFVDILRQNETLYGDVLTVLDSVYGNLRPNT